MRHAYLTALAAFMLFSSVSAADNAFLDPLDTQAVALQGSLVPSRQPYISVTRTGERLVAVGLRGLIVYSDDGDAWQQAKVPVQSDLTAVHFPNPTQGWSVGHDGVILRTTDGGVNWIKQFDGRSAEDKFGNYYQQRIAAGETHLAPYLNQVLLNAQGGAVLPFLDVHFDDDQHGYAIGSFGMITHTTDGGRTWAPWLEHIDNPNFLNLNAFHRIGEKLYIAGEHGSVFRLDRQQQRFINISTQYAGSFFGITGNEKYLLAYGLSGTAYRSVNDGDAWEAIDTGVRDSLTAASLTDEGVLVLTTDNGLLIYSTDEGRSFTSVQPGTPMLFSSITKAGPGRMLLAGYQGLVLQDISSITAPDGTQSEY